MKQPLTPADFLAGCIELDLRDLPIVEVPEGTHCRVSGAIITHGVAIQDTVSDANTEFIDQFAGDVCGYVSENAARAYKTAAPAHKHRIKSTGRMVANPCAKSHLACELDGEFEYFSPSFDPVTAAKNETVTWSAAIRDVWPRWKGRTVFIIVTPDFKRRLWPYSRTGIMGDRTPVYILNKSYNLDGRFTLDWEKLVSLLDIVEPLYQMGYTKDSLKTSLFASTNGTLEKIGSTIIGEKQSSEKPAAYKERCRQAGQSHAHEQEAVLKPLRGCTEFSLAVMTSVRLLTEAEMTKALKQREQALAEAKGKQL